MLLFSSQIKASIPERSFIFNRPARIAQKSASALFLRKSDSYPSSERRSGGQAANGINARGPCVAWEGLRLCRIAAEPQRSVLIPTSVALAMHHCGCGFAAPCNLWILNSDFG